MKKYNPDRHCPKCDWPGASTTYRPKYTVRSWQPDNSTVRHVPDALQRVCGRCGYRWEELPLDSEEEDNG